jgi:hypothetical protein
MQHFCDTQDGVNLKLEEGKNKAVIKFFSKESANLKSTNSWAHFVIANPQIF